MQFEHLNDFIGEVSKHYLDLSGLTFLGIKYSEEERDSRANFRVILVVQ